MTLETAAFVAVLGMVAVLVLCLALTQRKPSGAKPPSFWRLFG